MNGQARRGNPHHVGAMRGERAAGDRSGDDACQIEDAKSRERPCAFRKRPRRRVANLFDLHDGRGSDCGRLRMRCPFVRRAHRGHDAAALICFGLEGDGFPVAQRHFDRRTAGRAAKKLQNVAPVMREIHVQPHEPSIAGAIGAEQRIPKRGRRTAVDRQIMLAAELRRRMPHVDADRLPRRSGAMTQLRRGKPGGGDAGLCRGADAKRRWQHRIVAGKMQMFKGRCICAPQPPKARDRLGWRHRCAHSIPRRCGSQSDNVGM